MQWKAKEDYKSVIFKATEPNFNNYHRLYLNKNKDNCLLTKAFTLWIKFRHYSEGFVSIIDSVMAGDSVPSGFVFDHKSVWFALSSAHAVGYMQCSLCFRAVKENLKTDTEP